MRIARLCSNGHRPKEPRAQRRAWGLVAFGENGRPASRQLCARRGPSVAIGKISALCIDEATFPGKISAICIDGYAYRHYFASHLCISCLFCQSPIYFPRITPGPPTSAQRRARFGPLLPMRKPSRLRLRTPRTTPGRHHRRSGGRPTCSSRPHASASTASAWNDHGHAPIAFASYHPRPCLRSTSTQSIPRVPRSATFSSNHDPPFLMR